MQGVFFITLANLGIIVLSFKQRYRLTAEDSKTVDWLICRLNLSVVVTVRLYISY